MVKIKHKRKSTRELWIAAKSRASRKRSKQDVVHEMVVKYLENKIRCNFYSNVKKIIADSIAISPWMTGDILNCTAIRHQNNISNNQLLDKEEEKTDKSEHQTSVLGIISTINVNGGRPKGLTLKK